MNDTTKAVERLRNRNLSPLLGCGHRDWQGDDILAVCDALDQQQAEIAELTADLAGWKIAHGQKVDMLNAAEADRDRWRDNSTAKAALIDELEEKLTLCAVAEHTAQHRLENARNALEAKP